MLDAAPTPLRSLEVICRDTDNVLKGLREVDKIALCCFSAQLQHMVETSDVLRDMSLRKLMLNIPCQLGLPDRSLRHRYSLILELNVCNYRGKNVLLGNDASVAMCIVLDWNMTRGIIIQFICIIDQESAQTTRRSRFRRNPSDLSSRVRALDPIGSITSSRLVESFHQFHLPFHDELRKIACII